MVVEHMFVTTMDWTEVLAALMTPLEARGFHWEPNCTACGHDLSGLIRQGQMQCPECGTDATLKFAYGSKQTVDRKPVSDIPTTLDIRFDRGRVTVAASVQPKPLMKALHERVLTELVRSLERALAQGLSPDEAFQPWQEISQRLNVAGRWRKEVGVTILIIVIAIFLGLFVIKPP